MDWFLCSAIAQIIGVVISTILTVIIIYLTVRDKQKTKSLKELEKQTESLQNSFIELIKPNWSVIQLETASSTFFKFEIQNIGGGCKNFKLETSDSSFYIKFLNTINGESYGSHSIIECLIQHSQTDLIKSFDIDKRYYVTCQYEDVEGRKYKQSLVLIKIDLPPKNRIYFTAPENII